METPTNVAKIQSFFEDAVLSKLTDFINLLKGGNLHQFEELLSKVLQELHNSMAAQLMNVAAEKVEPALREQARQLRLGNLVKRDMKVQISTGAYVTVQGLYAQKAPSNYQGTRHLLRDYWKLQKGASPGYFSKICLYSVLCPSYDIAGQILEDQGVAYNRDRVRELTNHVAKYCKSRQAELSRAQGESFKGKRIVIGIDGGRTRMREYDGKQNAQGKETFDTPWREPKMFVIDVLDAEGKIEKTELPIYGCMFELDEMMNLLKSHLQGLQIEQAEQVQIVADGATWIWNRVRPILIELGVKEEKIVETVDYYHASQYVHKIIGGLPKAYSGDSKKIMKLFKDWLWEGRIKSIIEKCNQIFKRPNEEIKQCMGYLSKNETRMQYTDYKAVKLLCGSGIIESGIRRVINLRFKNASSFWKQENVESLYFLRGIMLSYRWKTMINNIIAS